MQLSQLPALAQGSDAGRRDEGVYAGCPELGSQAGEQGDHPLIILQDGARGGGKHKLPDAGLLGFEPPATHRSTKVMKAMQVMCAIKYEL